MPIVILKSTRRHRGRINISQFYLFGLLFGICLEFHNVSKLEGKILSSKEVELQDQQVPAIYAHLVPNKSHFSRPLEMLEEYKTYHSDQVLLEEFYRGGIHNRTFVVGLYSCPDAAGNRMHEFFNSAILAIAHNYTILWKFHDKSTCLSWGDPYTWCKDINSLEACDEVVTRATWVASYNEWSRKLGLVHGHRDRDKDYFSPDVNDTYIPNGNKVWLPTEKVMALSLQRLFQGQTKHTRAIERADELFSAGTYYLYGMLFQELFPFHENVMPSEDLIGGSEEVTSIVLHSRHVKVS
jgi:hypothetical protein